MQPWKTGPNNPTAADGKKIFSSDSSKMTRNCKIRILQSEKKAKKEEETKHVKCSISLNIY